MRAQRTRNIDNGHAQCLRVCAFGQFELTYNIQICSFDVTVDEQCQIRRVDVLLEVALVHLHQVMVAILCALLSDTHVMLDSLSRTVTILLKKIERKSKETARLNILE